MTITSLAGATTAPAPGSHTRRLAFRQHLLDTIRREGGEWTVGRLKPVCRNFRRSHTYRSTIRRHLARLTAEGHLDRHGVGTPRVFYTYRAPAPVCRCDEPDADPYECEADDCTGYFSELNPFGGAPVRESDAKVSRTCPVCGWRTSEWHVDDGSAEADLHGHVTRAHQGSYEKASTSA